MPGDLSIHDTLQRCWGYHEFRAHQEGACQAVLEGRDSLILMATGSGKSLCFQLPAAFAHSQDRRTFTSSSSIF